MNVHHITVQAGKNNLSNVALNAHLVQIYLPLSVEGCQTCRYGTFNDQPNGSCKNWTK